MGLAWAEKGFGGVLHERWQVWYAGSGQPLYVDENKFKKVEISWKYWGFRGEWRGFPRDSRVFVVNFV